MTDLDELPIDTPTADAAIELRGSRTLTAQLLDALRAHYAKPGEQFLGGVFLTEVQAPGRGTVRRADAVWVGFTSNPGPCIDVCEIKVSPEDYRRELADPTKADAWWPYCTRFWIVSPSPAVTPPEKLPAGWGLMCPKTPGRRFRVHREPEVRQPLVDLDLLMAIAKKMDTARADEVRAGLRQAQELAWRDYQKRLDAMNPMPEGVKRRLARLTEIETLLGIEVEDWARHAASVLPAAATPAQFAEAFRRLLGQVQADEQAARRVRHVVNAAQRRVEDLRRELRVAETAAAELATLAGEAIKP